MWIFFEFKKMFWYFATFSYAFFPKLKKYSHILTDFGSMKKTKKSLNESLSLIQTGAIATSLLYCAPEFLI